jgi:phage shock protein A
MNLTDTDLSGLSFDAAKEYLLAHITQLKLNEKHAGELEAEAAVWQERAALALDRDDAALAAEAEERAGALLNKVSVLRMESGELRAGIERMKHQLPSSAAARSVDPDLLLEELLMAAGRDPGGADLEKKFAALEKEAAAGAALDELKARMAGGGL